MIFQPQDLHAPLIFCILSKEPDVIKSFGSKVAFGVQEPEVLIPETTLSFE